MDEAPREEGAGRHRVELFDGAGQRAEATLVSIDARAAWAELTEDPTAGDGPAGPGGEGFVPGMLSVLRGDLLPMAI